MLKLLLVSLFGTMPVELEERCLFVTPKNRINKNRNF